MDLFVCWTVETQDQENERIELELKHPINKIEIYVYIYKERGGVRGLLPFTNKGVGNIEEEDYDVIVLFLSREREKERNDGFR